MDYKVVVASGDHDDEVARELEKRLKCYISSGWKPLGGVSVSRSDYGRFTKIVLAQAVIKE